MRIFFIVCQKSNRNILFTCLLSFSKNHIEMHLYGARREKFRFIFRELILFLRKVFVTNSMELLEKIDRRYFVFET